MFQNFSKNKKYIKEHFNIYVTNLMIQDETND